MQHVKALQAEFLIELEMLLCLDSFFPDAARSPCDGTGKTQPSKRLVDCHL